jgi:nucleoside phosphorylase
VTREAHDAKTSDPIAGDPTLVTAIVAAMPEEVRPIWRRLTRAAACRIGRARVLHGRLGRHLVVVAATGEGDKLARAAAAELLRVFPARRLIVAGAAGALSLGLRAGALVIADEVRRPGAEPMRPEGSLIEWAARASGARPAHVITTPAIASSVTAKAALDERHGDGGAAVVDLESAAYVEAAVDAGVPWLVLRSVADTAEESLPRASPGRCSAIRARCRACSICAAASPPADSQSRALSCHYSIPGLQVSTFAREDEREPGRSCDDRRR